MVSKKRLDMLVLEKGLADSREKAQALIAAGQVLVNGERCDKSGHLFVPNVAVTVLETMRYVSRGGFKLEKALLCFGVDLNGKHVLDVGASTGGFTDCALQHGASHVTAVDVGKGQIAWKLREDTRVTLLEKTNIRYLKQETLVAKPEMATVDVSFISLNMVFPALERLLPPQGEVVALVKPQFEVGRAVASRNRGVIKDPILHREALNSVLQTALNLNWALLGLTFSPLLGSEGNMEFLAYWRVGGVPTLVIDMDDVIRSAHETLR